MLADFEFVFGQGQLLSRHATSILHRPTSHKRAQSPYLRPSFAHVPQFVPDGFAAPSRNVFRRRTPEAQRELLAMQATSADRGFTRSSKIVREDR
jgi:hypothetical protein